MEFIYGLIGAFIGIGLFLLGFFVGRQAEKPVKIVKAEAVDGENGADIERMEKERQRLEAEQRAFRNLVGYSADIAYGVEKFPTESDV